MPDSSSGAGARGVSVWASPCEVMKQILDQSLGCLCLKTQQKSYCHPFHYSSGLRSLCESTFWCCFGAGLWSMWRPLPLVQRAAPPWSIWWLPLGPSDGSPFNPPLDRAFKLNAPILGVRNPNPQSKQQATLPRSLSVGWGSEPPGSGCSAHGVCSC